MHGTGNDGGIDKPRAKSRKRRGSRLRRPKSKSMAGVAKGGLYPRITIRVAHPRRSELKSAERFIKGMGEKSTPIPFSQDTKTEAIK